MGPQDLINLPDGTEVICVSPGTYTAYWKAGLKYKVDTFPQSKKKFLSSDFPHCNFDIGTMIGMPSYYSIDFAAVQSPEKKLGDKDYFRFINLPSEKHKCRCDMRTVIMVTGCKCGGE